MGLVPFPTGTSNLARRFNRGAWSMGRSPMAKWALAEKALVADRRARGLPVDGWHVMDRRLSPGFNIALVSPQYVAPASDWGDDYPFVGFTPWTTADDPLPAAVEEYLDAGEPPVLVCLGTSAASAAPHVFDLTARALDDLGLRGLYLASNLEIAERLGDRPGVWPFVPVGPLLPRVSGCRACGCPRDELVGIECRATVRDRSCAVRPALARETSRAARDRTSRSRPGHCREAPHRDRIRTRRAHHDASPGVRYPARDGERHRRRVQRDRRLSRPRLTRESARLLSPTTLHSGSASHTA